MGKLAGLRANKHNNRQVDKQSAGVMSCVGSDEGTYFRPACGLGNDKSATQKENEGCQTKQNPHPDAISLARTQLSSSTKSALGPKLWMC